MQLRQLGVTIAVVLGVASIVAVPARSYAADDDEKPTPVDATPKGTIGLGLLGAELGVAIPAIIGVDATWAYIVFPAVGAGGGAVAGYFLIDDKDHAEAAVALLTAGLTLVIPTLVLAVAATSYDPDDEIEQASLGTGALRFDQGALKLAAPGIGLVQNTQAGKSHVSGLSLSVVSGRF
ncbi:MAG TPA: hypothetical protein VJR89_14185 [Polyangiales bacterium]|nr:hypothetical protein [Polyangiales bacterium]